MKHSRRGTAQWPTAIVTSHNYLVDVLKLLQSLPRPAGCCCHLGLARNRDDPYLANYSVRRPRTQGKGPLRAGLKHKAVICSKMAVDIDFWELTWFVGVTVAINCLVFLVCGILEIVERYGLFQDAKIQKKVPEITIRT